MKVGIIHAIAAYTELEKIPTATLEVEDIVAILGMRRGLRPLVEDYNAFIKDAKDKFRPSDVDRLADIERKGEEATDEERTFYDNAMKEYNDAVTSAVNAEYADGVEVEVSLPITTIAKISRIMEWKIGEIELFNTFASETN